MTRIVVPVPDKDPRRQLGELIQRSRVELGYSHRDLATRVGVSVDVVREWESGSAVPRGRQWPRLKGTLRRVAPATAVWQAALRVADDVKDVEREEDEAVLAEKALRLDPGSMPEPEGELPALRDPLAEKTFGSALAVARLNEGLAQREIGELVGVPQSTVSSWERDDNTPVRENFEKLLDLLPVLRRYPEPEGVLERPKPPGNVYGAQGAGRPPGVPQPTPAGGYQVTELYGRDRDRDPRVRIHLAMVPSDFAPTPTPTPAPAPKPRAPTPPAGHPALSGLDVAGIAYAKARKAWLEANGRILGLERELEAARKAATDAQEVLDEAQRGLDQAIADS